MQKLALACVCLASAGFGPKTQAFIDKLQLTTFTESQALHTNALQEPVESFQNLHGSPWSIAANQSNVEVSSRSMLNSLKMLAILLLIPKPAAAFHPAVPDVLTVTNPKHSSLRPVVSERLDPSEHGVTLMRVKVQSATSHPALSQPSNRKHGLMWPFYKEGQFHRFITDGDPRSNVTGSICKTPEIFKGTRQDGSYLGSFRVQFSLPGKEHEPKTIEFLQSRDTDKPVFGAVKVQLPLDATILSDASRSLVTKVKEGSNAEKANIKQGDIIRAMSFVGTTDTIGGLPDVEDGMVILDGKSAADHTVKLQENFLINGQAAEAVLLIERPTNVTVKLLVPADDEGESSPLPAEVLPPEDDQAAVRTNAGTPQIDPGVLMLPYRLNVGSDHARRTLRSYNKRELKLQSTHELVQTAHLLSSELGRKPTFTEVALYMDKSGRQTDADRYNFHLNALSVIRKKHDLLYSQDAFPSPEDRLEIETLPGAAACRLTPDKLKADPRQKGPDGESFVALIADPSNPKSLYLQNISKRFEDADVFRKLDKVIEDFVLQEKETVAKEDFYSAFGFVDPTTIDEAGKVLVRLGLQVWKRRCLGEPQLDSETLWLRIVARTDEIYQVAEEMHEVYRLAILELLHKVGLDETSFIFGPLKDPVRIYEKAMDDYAHGAKVFGDGVLPEAWVRDVVRGGILAEEGRKMIEFQNLLFQKDGLQLGGMAGNTELRFLRVKNKFEKPGPTRFRYILNNIELKKGPLSMLCEVQIHHNLILMWDGKLDSHFHYDFFRAALLNKTALIPAGGTFDPDAEIERRLQEYEEVFRALFWYGMDYWSDAHD